MRWVIAWIVAAGSFGLLDALWLRWAGPNLYRPVLGEVLADQFRLGPALLFYLCYISVMVWFAVRPGLTGGAHMAVLNGALLGAIAYATYDLTNQATLKVWSSQISAIDIAWGTAATALASGIAALAARKFGA